MLHQTNFVDESYAAGSDRMTIAVMIAELFTKENREAIQPNISDASKAVKRVDTFLQEIFDRPQAIDTRAFDAVCRTCKTKHSRLWSRDEYCSDACRAKLKANHALLKWKYPERYQSVKSLVDVTDEIVVEADEPQPSKGDTVACRKCGEEYVLTRVNKQYCSPSCAKNGTRGPRTVEDASDKRADLFRQLGLVEWMNDTFYGSWDEERWTRLESWLTMASHDPEQVQLRKVFMNPTLNKPERYTRKMKRPVFRPSLCYHQKQGCPPVSAVADEFCKLVYGCRVWKWVDGTAPDPISGEVVRLKKTTK